MSGKVSCHGCDLGSLDALIVRKLGDPIEIVGLQDKVQTSVVTGIEMFHKSLDMGMAGDNAGVLLRGIDREDVERGMVLAKPKSITPHRRFMSEVYVLRKEAVL